MLSRFDVDGHVPRTQTAFLRCIVTLSLCSRNPKAFLGDVRHAFCQVLEKFSSFFAEGAKGLDSDGTEFIHAAYDFIFQSLPQLSPQLRPGKCLVEMTWSQRVETSHTPHETPTLLPWHHRHTIRSFPIRSRQ
jgi:hypothetical protein